MRSTGALAGVLVALLVAACGGSASTHASGRLLYVTVSTPGMEPTIKTNGRVPVRLTHAAPRLYQLVAFHPPTSSNPTKLACTDTNQGPSLKQPCGIPAPRESATIFIERVVGLPGDRIAVMNGRIIRNGVGETRPTVPPCVGVPECSLPKPIVIPRGHYYLVGDNRGDSNDSRFWGPVPKSWIIGAAVR